MIMNKTYQTSKYYRISCFLIAAVIVVATYNSFIKNQHIAYLSPQTLMMHVLLIFMLCIR